ncbi:MAG: LCP family protein [Acutalibacteraceae bacterium]|nr:LCP family protein [Acutalibacteraceae bacterium]
MSLQSNNSDNSEFKNNISNSENISNTEQPETTDEITETEYSSDESEIKRKKRKKIEFSVSDDNANIPVAKYQKKKTKKTKKEKKKKSKVFVFFTALGTTIVAILLIIAIVLGVLLLNGKNSVLNANESGPSQEQLPASAKVEDDYIVYNGEKYKYNDKVTTILFAGIDKNTDEHLDGVLGTAGQADAIFVMALNTETGKYKLMAVSRDTMVDVNVCDSLGNFKGTEKMQICLAHAYGDGKETSNENLKRSVSRLFFGIPVNAYMTIDLDAIPVLNDAVGGVTVNVIEDLSDKDPELVKGKTVTLKGKQAETYVRTRDIYGDENQNNLRMERQKSYLNSFIKQTLALTKQDISTPINLYNSIADYTRTDIDASKISYLASVFLQNGFSSDEDFIKVPGETVLGEKYAEYYTDRDEFFKIILDTYYTKVE